MKNKDQEDKATLRPRTYVENGRASLRRRRCGLGNWLMSRHGTAGLWIQRRSPDKRVNLLSPPLVDWRRQKTDDA